MADIADLLPLPSTSPRRSLKESYLLNLIPMLWRLRRKGAHFSVHKRYQAVRKAASFSLVCATGGEENWCKALLRQVVWKRNSIPSLLRGGGARWRAGRLYYHRQRSHFKPCITLLKRVSRRSCHFLCRKRRPHSRAYVRGKRRRKHRSRFLDGVSGSLLGSANGELSRSCMHGDGASQHKHSLTFSNLLARFRTLVPGGDRMEDLSTFLQEAANYISALEVQVDALSMIVAGSHLSLS